jgi:hypothetical protein
MKKTIIFAVLLLTACAGNSGRDYDGSARCQGMGYKPGTAEYEQCLKEEKAARLMEQQRQLDERREQERRDQINRRYTR